MKNNTKRPEYLPKVLALATLVAATSPLLLAQKTIDSTDDKKNDKDEEMIFLSPFEVSTKKDTGYAASSSLAGSRLNTPLRDVASAISVVTPEFMKDTASTDLQHILVYQTNTEASGIGGNYYGSNADDANY